MMWSIVSTAAQLKFGNYEFENLAYWRNLGQNNIVPVKIVNENVYTYQNYYVC